jgi:hypothetical protein
MGIKVDKWGNVWDEDDTERKFPVWPHPELEERKAACTCGKYVWRSQRPDGTFQWQCGCGKVYAGLHH